jgi:hypothetical protein
MHIGTSPCLKTSMPARIASSPEEQRLVETSCLKMILIQTCTQSLLPWCRRYGLIGPNGCGKSCLLKSLAAREVAIPEHIDIYFLDREVGASDETALDCVKSVDEERIRLDKESEKLMEGEMTPEVEQRLEDIYERYGHRQLHPPLVGRGGGHIECLVFP